MSRLGLLFDTYCGYIYGMTNRGRPEKPAGSRKADFLKIRLEALEKDAFQQACNIVGIPLSAWVRERLRRAAIKELEDVGMRAPFLKDIYAK